MDADFTLKGRVYRRTKDDQDLPFDDPEAWFEVAGRLLTALEPLHAAMSLGEDGSFEALFSVVDEPG